MAEFDIEGRYPTLTLPEQLEEAIAEAFAEVAAGLRKSDNSLVGTAFRKIAKLLKAIRSVFTGAGFQTAEDIFDKVYDGKLTKRAAEKQALSRRLYLPKDVTPALQPISIPGRNAAQGKNQALADDLAMWRKALVRFFEKKAKPSDDLRVGRVPEVLQYLGVRSGIMVMRANKVIIVIGKHTSLPVEALRDLPNLISDPRMVILQEGKESDAIIITDTKTADGKPVVVAFKKEGVSNNGQRASVILTVYPLDDAKPRIQHWASQGDTLYLRDESSIAEYELTGAYSLRGPRRDLSGNAAPQKILQHRDVFKGQGGQAKLQAARLPSRQARAHMATSMQGAIYVPDRRVWEELHRSGAPIWSRMREGAAALNDTLDRARIKLQDRFLPVMRAQQAIEKSMGAPLPEEYDAYLTETTFSGKAGRHLFDIDETYTKPIIGLIAETDGDLTVDQVREYLTALHAEERNARIAKINPKMPDGGSGMTTAKAQSILAAAASRPHAARLKKIARPCRQPSTPSQPYRRLERLRRFRRKNLRARHRHIHCTYPVFG